MFLLIFSGIATVAMLLWEGIIIGGFLFIPEDIRGSFNWRKDILPIAVYVISTLMMGGLFCFTLSEYAISNVGYNSSMCQIEKITTSGDGCTNEAESFYYRMKASPQVQSYMDQMRLESKGTRTFIIEMLNGKYNYGALTYESVSEGHDSVLDDYNDFSLERYPTLGRIYEEGYWFGTVDELIKEDKHLALKLKANDMEYFAATMIYGSKGGIGFIGVIYDHTDVNIPKAKQVLVKYAMKISLLLDGAEAGKKKIN